MRPRSGDPLTRTKLIATIGPASSPPQVLHGLLDAGVDVCRLNFSHGAHEDHGSALQAIRAWSSRHGRPVAVLGDLCGPKIRLNAVEGDAFVLPTGASTRLVSSEEAATPAALTTRFAPLVQEASVGHRIYIDDGLVRLLVVEREPDALRCAVTAGGRVASRKGINLPDTRLALPALTDKDKADLEWAVEHELDFVALSFVRRPADVTELRGILRNRGSDLGVIVKIEKVEALEHLEELIELSDGVMIARGDLGVEMDVWQVPLIQKAITARCRAAGKPVIVATQMLQSMIQAPMPTRAEVSDVATAILDQNDAVMLSAETAAGDHPDAAVGMIARVANAAESYRAELPADAAPSSMPAGGRVAAAIARGAAQAALHIAARLVAVWTFTGNTVRLMAQARLPMPVIGLTSDPRLFRRLNLLYGVTPLLVEPMSDPGRMARVLDQRLVAEGLARSGDAIVVVTSTAPTRPDATDTTLIHHVGR